MTPHPRTLQFVMICLACAAPVPAQQASALQAGPFAPTVSTGKVQGKVVLDSGGLAVPGVSVSLVSTGGAGAASAVQSFTSTADGSFSIPNLAAGRYTVCVKDPKAAVIDPCSWTDSLTTLTAAASNTSSSFTVRVKKASAVSVQVNDTAQVLAAAAVGSYPPHVLVGAFDGRNTFHPAREVQKTAAGIVYQLTIPVDSPIRMTVYSAQVKLTTSSNLAVPAQGYSTTFVQPSASAQTKAFTFSAVGKN